MENSADSSGRNWLRPGGATAIGLGIVLGSVMRELPIAVSSSIWLRANGSRQCDGAALDCAVAAVPDVIGGLVVFGLLVISVALVVAAGGAVLVVHGLRRGKPAGIEARSRARGLGRSSGCRIRPSRDRYGVGGTGGVAARVVLAVVVDT